MQPTVDPGVFIEEQYPGYVRYFREEDGARWEVIGTCDRRGNCLVGAVVSTPDGPVQIDSLEHLIQLTDQYGEEIFNTEMDTPVTWEFGGCCEFTYNVLT